MKPFIYMKNNNIFIRFPVIFLFLFLYRTSYTIAFSFFYIFPGHILPNHIFWRPFLPLTHLLTGNTKPFEKYLLSLVCAGKLNRNLSIEYLNTKKWETLLLLIIFHIYFIYICYLIKIMWIFFSSYQRQNFWLSHWIAIRMLHQFKPKLF